MSPRRTLEDTLSITVGAFLFKEHYSLAIADAQGLYALNDVGHLSTVCADVLHGRRTRFAGNVRKVFCAVISVLHEIVHGLVPHLARTDAHPQAAVGGRSERFESFDAGMEHCAGVVAHKNEVAAAADVEIFCVAQLGQEGKQVVLRVVFHKLAATGIDAERVMMKQGKVGGSGNHYAKVFSKRVDEEIFVQESAEPNMFELCRAQPKITK